MKNIDFEKCYLAFVNLYNAILSEDAYGILKYYYPDLTKNELLADLRAKDEEEIGEYAVYKADDNIYLICSGFMEYEDVIDLFNEQEGKQFYIPDTLDEFLLYSKATYVEENEAFKLMESYFIDHYELDLAKAKLFTKLVSSGIQNLCTMDESIEELEELCQFDHDDINTFAMIYEILANNTRYAELRGHTPSEMAEIENIA